MFPVKLQDGELNWKVVLHYDSLTNSFPLQINGIYFLQMPLQSELNPEGPQNIERGAIKLNGEEVHEGWAQYTAETFDEMHEKIEF